MFHFLKLTILLAVFALNAAQAFSQQASEQRIGAGLSVGSSQALYLLYALSPNVHAGIVAGTQTTYSSFGQQPTLYTGPFGRFLLPLDTSGIAPFASLTYHINFANALGYTVANSFGVSVGVLSNITTRVRITAQLDPFRFGVLATKELVPFSLWTFPNARIGVELYF
jgi:hypothetical protein